MTARPLAPSANGEHLGLGADVDAARGFVEASRRWVGRQHLADDHLLLVAAGQRPDHRRAAIGLDMDVRGSTGRPARACSHRREGKEAAGEGSAMLASDRFGRRSCLHQAVALPVLGGGRARCDRSATAATRRPYGIMRPPGLGRPATHSMSSVRPAPIQAIDADDLAGANVERRAVDDGIVRRGPARLRCRC